MIQTKRVYEVAAKADGFRVLVDRLWPRGLSKEKAHVDLWMKEIAPSNELRQWFHHQKGSWNEFEKRYKAELVKRKSLLNELQGLVREHGRVTLLFGSKNEKENQAVVLAGMLEKR